MSKTNASQRKKRDVRSIGKNQPQERRFGLKIQRHVNGAMPLNVPQLLNTEPSKKNIRNAPMSHINTVKTTKRRDVSPIKTVKIFQSKNVETSIPRHLDKLPNKYPSEYVVIIVLL